MRVHAASVKVVWVIADTETMPGSAQVFQARMVDVTLMWGHVLLQPGRRIESDEASPWRAIQDEGIEALRYPAGFICTGARNAKAFGR